VHLPLEERGLDGDTGLAQPIRESLTLVAERVVLGIASLSARTGHQCRPNSVH